MDGVLVRETRLCACRRSSSERGTCNAAGCIPSFPCTCNVHVLFRHYRHRGKISVPAVPRRRRRGCCKVPYRHSFLHVKLLPTAKYRQPTFLLSPKHLTESLHTTLSPPPLSSPPHPLPPAASPRTPWDRRKQGRASRLLQRTSAIDGNGVKRYSSTCLCSPRQRKRTFRTKPKIALGTEIVKHWGKIQRPAGR